MEIALVGSGPGRARARNSQPSEEENDWEALGPTRSFPTDTEFSCDGSGSLNISSMTCKTSHFCSAAAGEVALAFRQPRLYVIRWQGVGEPIFFLLPLRMVAFAPRRICTQNYSAI